MYLVFLFWICKEKIKTSIMDYIWQRNCISYFGLKLYFGFFGIDFGSFVSKVFVDVGNGSGSGSSSSLLNCDGTCSCWVSVVVSLCGCCSVMDSLGGCCSEMDSLCGCSCEVDGLGAAVLPFEVHLFLGAFFPGSYFFLLVAEMEFLLCYCKIFSYLQLWVLGVKKFFSYLKVCCCSQASCGVFKRNARKFWVEWSWKY